MRKIVILITILMPLASLADLSSELEVNKIVSDLYILKEKEYGTNIGVISTEDGLVLIDPMPGADSLVELEEVIKSIFKQPIHGILNTHQHEDHVGGNEYFSKKGAQILENTKMLDALQQSEVVSHSANDRVFFHKTSNTIFVGDVFDNSWHPTFYAGGLRGFDAAIDKILNIGDEQSLIVPGHGKPATKESLRTFRTNTHAWVARVEKLLDNKQTVQEMINDKELMGILARFNTEQKAPFLPEKAVTRFIERTIALLQAGADTD